ncbi:MAG: hypothetical protein SGI84_10835 [Gemmatimonadota bacterium]|nr:hypothetical protein [Gemmatimonadota bacterium]
MTPATRWLPIVLAWAALVVGGSVPVSAQSSQAPLTFRGLRAAMTRAGADSVLVRHGTSLRCRPTREPRIEACSAQATLDGQVATLTVSLVDGLVGIALVSARLPAEQVADWHATLVNAYGEVDPQRRPGQESFQWIRARQMLRLTVRREAGGLVASVSLLDGRLLDSLPSP